ncbi:hypothetical protein HNY73_002280 [Argiope bruennichi]|uniref:Uncharacterized protein n=1 Tax=Argiope bruennichi TaxID=94029 RepID=A0A8T0FT03_ARGBR|nr:hypothetical protein HNY73_002280 [Argiope bruennichi]
MLFRNKEGARQEIPKCWWHNRPHLFLLSLLLWSVRFCGHLSIPGMAETAGNDHDHCGYFHQDGNDFPRLGWDENGTNPSLQGLELFLSL